MRQSSFDSEQWLRRYCRDIQDFLQRRTVALLVYKGEPGPGKIESRGTGVLVRVGDRHFILTAGHCVAGCVAPGRRTYIPISAAGRGISQEQFSPTLAKWNYVAKHKGTVDYGYLELSNQSASTIAAKIPIFAGENSVAARRPSTTEPDEWVLVAGYPAEEAKTTDRVYVARFMFALTLSARKEELPEDHAKPPNGFQVIDSWLPSDSVVSPVAGEFHSVEASSFRGASGGGCWTVDVSIDPKRWTADTKPSLCAIHASTLVTEGEGDDMLREVPIVYHLRMIADDYPELSPDMHKRWPEIANLPPAHSLR